MENKQHVQLPNNMAEKLTPQDILIYLYLKRHMNKDTKEAFPSLDLLTKEAHAAINTIRKSIQNLVNAGFIEIRTLGRKHIYKFLKYDNFEPFSEEFLDREDLSFTEKAYLAVTQQFMIKENNIGKVSMTNTELARKINMTPSTISRCNKSLEDKQMLISIDTMMHDIETGGNLKERMFLLEKYSQQIVFILKNHEERISDNEQNIEELKTENATLRKDMDMLIRKVQELEANQKSKLIL